MVKNMKQPSKFWKWSDDECIHTFHRIEEMVENFWQQFNHDTVAKYFIGKMLDNDTTREEKAVSISQAKMYFEAGRNK